MGTGLRRAIRCIMCWTAVQKHCRDPFSTCPGEIRERGGRRLRTVEYVRGMLLLVAAMGIGLFPAGRAGNAAGSPPSFSGLSAAEAAELIRAYEGRADFVILDVRTRREFERDHLRSAVLEDYRSGTFAEDVGRLDRNRIYLLYCASGNRSGKAMEIMRSLGFRNVFHMAGGIGKWKEEGRPVVVP